ncbi:MAG TPA: GNA1162 family protein [Burkholderiaceae bacterium]|nr:GNA1162 family protein [Burkholderiaceae bacterium]
MKRALILGLLASLLLGACATKPPKDYSLFQRAHPASILVLPPINESPDVKATPAVWSSLTRPLAEAGYYVVPVTLADETFKQNGVTTSHDAQQIPADKLRQFFGADAALYVTVREYGSSYRVIVSETAVQVNAKLVDLRDGALLWEGTARASSAEQQQSQSSVIGLLVQALVNQIAGSVTDAAYGYAGTANARLIGGPEGVLYGPRSPRSGQPPAKPR